MEHFVARSLQNFEEGKIRPRQLFRRLGVAASSASSVGSAPAYATEETIRASGINHVSFRHVLMIFAATLGMLLSTVAVAQQQRAKPPQSMRLYVFDCGSLNMSDPGRYSLKREEMVTTMMSVPCFLVAHPKGFLMWDVGVIPDGIAPSGAPVTVNYATVVKPLLPQLSEAGFAPADINYLAISHFHWDHLANANSFASATWLVRPLERDVMFADQPPSERTAPTNYSALKNSKTVIIKTDEYDVFGDGAVILKSAPGHSPDHQVLFLKLPKTGPVLLSGDLWHYPEERSLNRYPKFDFNIEQTKASRQKIDAYLKKTGAQLWIQHDFTANAKLKKAPAYYE
jgi:N-acyl homoserine lactone hydrolase